MILDSDDAELKALINHRYVGKYKSYRSNANLIRDLDKVMRVMMQAKNILDIAAVRSLSYERLTSSPYSSVRVGFKRKYRLIFLEREDKVTLLLLELSEHYGDH